MLRKEKSLPWKEILDITDKEFCEKIGISVEDLEKVKAELNPSNELEHRKRWFKAYMNTNDGACEY